jgi:hypothetical protein
MNILPLVMVLLFVLVLGTKSLVETKVASFWEERAISGVIAARRDAHNQQEKKKYTRADKNGAQVGPLTPAPQPESVQKKRKEIPFSSRRRASNLHEASRLNISLLLMKNQSPIHDRVVAVATNLVTLLYSHAPFFQEGKKRIPDLERRLIEQMVAAGKKRGECRRLIELAPADPYLHALFLKMVQGTNRWDFLTHTGYPPLTEFFSIDENRKPVQFCLASEPVLIAFFGKETTKLVLEKEEEKWEGDYRQKSVSKGELAEILKLQPKLPCPASEIMDCCGFIQRSGPRGTIRGEDKTSGIQVKATLR